MIKGLINHMPQVLFTKAAEKGHWLLMPYYQGRQHDLSDYLSLAESLSDLHGHFKGKTVKKSWYKYSEHELDSLIDLNCHELTILKDVIKGLDKIQKTLLHGDMIPLNLIASDKLYIIDWEHGQSGPYILDISRLLGDYNIDKAWVDKAYHDEIRDTYYQNITKKITLKRRDFDYHFLCGLAYNYLGIVEVHYCNKLDKGSWFDLNLKLLKEVLERINSLS